MKYCIGCNISNRERRFVDGWCEDCYGAGSVKDVVASELVVKCWECGERYSGSSCPRCVRGRRRGVSARKIDVDVLRVIRDGVGILDVVNRKAFVKKEIVKEYEEVVLLDPTCKYCGGFEAADRPFYVYRVRSGKEVKKNYHLDCREKRAKDVIKKWSDYSKEQYALKKGGNFKKKVFTIEERIMSLPDVKECSKCGDEKLIAEFYIDKRGYAYPHCKKCHRVAQKKIISKNPEKYKEYMREYHKTYDRNNPRRKSKLPKVFIKKHSD